jgi:hypothetical protein
MVCQYINGTKGVVARYLNDRTHYTCFIFKKWPDKIALYKYSNQKGRQVHKLPKEFRTSTQCRLVTKDVYAKDKLLLDEPSYLIHSLPVGSVAKERDRRGKKRHSIRFLLQMSIICQ